MILESNVMDYATDVTKCDDVNNAVRLDKTQNYNVKLAKAKTLHSLSFELLRLIHNLMKLEKLREKKKSNIA